jgi:hypothetical protein
MAGPIQFPDGSNPVGGEWNAGQYMMFAWDGARFQVLNAQWGKPTFTQKIPGFFHAHATVGTTTTLPANVWTKITVSIEDNDSEGWYDPALSRFQPTKPGYYFVSGDAGFVQAQTLQQQVCELIRTVTLSSRHRLMMFPVLNFRH